ncbi:MAG: hypothetical protein ABI432_07840 [Flavobacteriales bacterium]
MRNLISFQRAANSLLVILGLVLLFQMVVLLGHVPTELVWGGNLTSVAERTVMAVITIAVVALIMALIVLRAGRSLPKWARVARVGMWGIVGLFGLNVFGNLAAKDLRETLLFTPVALVLFFLAWRVALGRERDQRERGGPKEETR